MRLDLSRILVVFIAFSFPWLSFGELGGDVASIDKDALALHASHNVMRASAVSVQHELKTQSVTLHQYLGQDNKVYAVAWRGVQHPDLKTVLGDYYAGYLTAIGQLQSRKIRTRAAVIEVGNLHVEVGGHPGLVFSHVWLIDRIPVGTSTNDIQ